MMAGFSADKPASINSEPLHLSAQRPSLRPANVARIDQAHGRIAHTSTSTTVESSNRTSPCSNVSTKCSTNWPNGPRTQDDARVVYVGFGR